MLVVAAPITIWPRSDANASPTSADEPLPLSLQVGTGAIPWLTSSPPFWFGARLEAYDATVAVGGTGLLGSSDPVRSLAISAGYAITMPNARVHMGFALWSDERVPGYDFAPWSPWPQLGVDFASGRWLWEIGLFRGAAPLAANSALSFAATRALAGPRLRSFGIDVVAGEIPTLGGSLTHGLGPVDVRWNIRMGVGLTDISSIALVAFGAELQFGDPAAVRWHLRKLGRSR